MRGGWRAGWDQKTDATLSLSDVYINIPFKASDTFQAFNVFPFPTAISDSLHSVHLLTPLILVSGDFLHTALPTLYFLLQCHMSLQHLHICPSVPLSILPALSIPCITALVRDYRPEAACTYTTIGMSILGNFYSFMNECQSQLPVRTKRPLLSWCKVLMSFMQHVWLI